MLVHPLGQNFDPCPVEVASRTGGIDKAAVVGGVLYAGGHVGGGVPAGVPAHHLSRGQINCYRPFSRQGTGLVGRDVDVLALTREVPVVKGSHDADVGVMAGDVPGVAAAGCDGWRIRHVFYVIS